VNEDELRQHVKDEEHLSLLALGYKVSAGAAAFFSMFGLLYVVMGLIVSRAPLPSSAFVTPSSVAVSGSSAFVGWFFGAMGFAILAVGLGFAALKWTVARRLEQRRSIGFCQVVAALSCLEIPYGTMLGVLTFMALARPSVRLLFEQAEATRSA
jgi:hypothetical protein